MSEKERGLGIEVGDFISGSAYHTVTESASSSPAYDKVSAAILLNLLRVYKEENIQLPVTTIYLVSLKRLVMEPLSLPEQARLGAFSGRWYGGDGDDQHDERHCSNQPAMLQDLIIIASICKFSQGAGHSQTDIFIHFS